MGQRASRSFQGSIKFGAAETAAPLQELFPYVASRELLLDQNCINGSLSRSSAGSIVTGILNCINQQLQTGSADSSRILSDSSSHVASSNSLNCVGITVGAAQQDFAGLASIGNSLTDTSSHAVVAAVDSLQVRILSDPCSSSIQSLLHIPIAGSSSDQIHATLFESSLSTGSAVLGRRIACDTLDHCNLRASLQQGAQILSAQMANGNVVRGNECSARTLYFEIRKYFKLNRSIISENGCAAANQLHGNHNLSLLNGSSVHD